MRKFWFFDLGTNEDIFIEDETVSGAIIKSLQMVLDQVAVHPVFVCEV